MKQYCCLFLLVSLHSILVPVRAAPAPISSIPTSAIKAGDQLRIFPARRAGLASPIRRRGLPTKFASVGDYGMQTTHAPELGTLTAEQLRWPASHSPSLAMTSVGGPNAANLANFASQEGKPTGFGSISRVYAQQAIRKVKGGKPAFRIHTDPPISKTLAVGIPGEQINPSNHLGILASNGQNRVGTGVFHVKLKVADSPADGQILPTNGPMRRPPNLLTVSRSWKARGPQEAAQQANINTPVEKVRTRAPEPTWWDPQLGLIATSPATDLVSHSQESPGLSNLDRVIRRPHESSNPASLANSNSQSLGPSMTWSQLQNFPRVVDDLP